MRKKVTVDLRVLAVVVVVAVALGVTGYWYVTVAKGQIHEALGVYGLQIAQKQGIDTSWWEGSWWQGYENFEKSATAYVCLGFAVGALCGGCGTLAVTITRRHTREE